MKESYVTITITKMMYGWSKWGGATNGLAKETLDEWYCQSCGKKQTKTLPSYMVPLDGSNRDFFRVCSECKAKAVKNHVSFVFDLIKLVKEINI